jgi:hypothetical protein
MGMKAGGYRTDNLKREMNAIKQRLADIAIERFELWERYKLLNHRIGLYERHNAETIEKVKIANKS